MLALVFALAVQDKVGAKHYIDPNNLPGLSKSVLSTPKIIRGKGHPDLQAPPGFSVKPFAEGLFFPRNLAVAPNGDVFVVEAEAGQVTVLRDDDGDGYAETMRRYCRGLTNPHGIAFHGGYLYIANTGSIIRYKYRPGDLEATGKPETVVDDLPAKPGYNMHWTRNIAFSLDGKRMFVTVGSATNDDIEPFPRATILSYTPEGKDRQLVASGLRNAVGLLVHPATGDLWATCIERDFMGDHIPPDYLAQIKSGEFFGWPWFFIGNNVDPNHKGDKPPRTDVTVPDVLFEAHSTPIGACFYTGTMFPAEYQGDMFLAMRGSTNAVPRTGYKIVRVHFRSGRPDPVYEDFIVGWVPDRMEQWVWGRPVAVAVAKDGALLVVDESAHMLWRVTYSPPSVTHKVVGS